MSPSDGDGSNLCAGRGGDRAARRGRDRAAAGEFRSHLANVVLRIEDFADDEVLDALGIEDPFELSGLYSGRPMREETSWASGELPPMIHLYRRPLLDEWAETGRRLEELITHVIVHEIGHHFGFSDADMHAHRGAGG